MRCGKIDWVLHFLYIFTLYIVYTENFICTIMLFNVLVIKFYEILKCEDFAHLELSYRYQTCHDGSCEVQLRKRSNSVSIT